MGGRRVNRSTPNLNWRTDVPDQSRSNPQSDRRRHCPLAGVKRHKLTRTKRLRGGDMQDVEAPRANGHRMDFGQPRGKAKHHRPLQHRLHQSSAAKIKLHVPPRRRGLSSDEQTSKQLARSSNLPARKCRNNLDLSGATFRIFLRLQVLHFDLSFWFQRRFLGISHSFSYFLGLSSVDFTCQPFLYHDPCQHLGTGSWIKAKTLSDDPAELIYR